MTRRGDSDRGVGSTDDLDVALRHDLATFLHMSFAHLNPQTPYLHNWHIDLLADRLTRVFLGKTRRLIINVPPRSLKSNLASVAFPAWALGRNPALRFIHASYGQELANKLARDTLAVMTSVWYQRAFDTRLARRSAAPDFETTMHGGRMATSVGGVLTGRGGDIIVIDDPVKPDEALSDVQRQSANDWFDHTVSTRLNDKLTGAIIIVMQRLHMDDLVGHVLDLEDWEVVSLPAIAAEEEVWEYATVAGLFHYVRQPGDLLHEAREPRLVLDAMQKTLGSFAFSAQYLQAPVVEGGNYVQRDWLRSYAPSERPETFDTIVQSWDTASKEREVNDYSVCTTWGVKGLCSYLLDVFRRRVDYPALKRAFVAQAALWNPQVILIEDHASGTQLFQEMRSVLPAVKAVKPEGDKVLRLRAQTAQMENGFVRVPVEAPWLADYVNELIGFPKLKYDDQVDSTSQALRWIALESGENGLFTYYLGELARERGITIDEARAFIRNR